MKDDDASAVVTPRDRTSGSSSTSSLVRLDSASVYLDKESFDNLSPAERELFQDPDEEWRVPTEDELAAFEQEEKGAAASD